MKTMLFFLLTLALTSSLQAQDCKGSLYMTANAKLKMTIYDKKGKESGVQTIAISDVKSSGGTYQSTVNTTMTDEKGKVLGNGSGTYKCSNGAFSVDMKMSLPQEGMAGMKNAEAKFEPVYLEYPASPTVGQKLSDAELKMDMTTNGGMQSTIIFKQENRTVSAKESVTSPAGTWEAYVISYDGSTKARMAGIGLPAFSFSVKEWYVPGTGIVKTETYGKNGKPAGSTLLTGITK